MYLKASGTACKGSRWCYLNHAKGYFWHFEIGLMNLIQLIIIFYG